MPELRTTEFHQKHLDAGARMAPFGGWDMPIQYRGILAEHRAVRGAAGLFDISHMGQLVVGGAGATAWLDRVLSNQAGALSAGVGHYSFLLNEQGGVIDDLFVYRLADDRFLLVVNAARHDEDVAWLRGHIVDGVVLEDRGGGHVALALQGPKAPAIMTAFLGSAGVVATPPARNRILRIPELDMDLAGTGYTGEDGYEMFFPARHADRVWTELLDVGTAHGLTLCGLGARDSLRLEMGYPLHGADLDTDHTPLEAGAAWAVRLDKGDFIGRDALLAQKAAGLPARLTGFELTGKSPPPRPHYRVFADGEPVGETTSAMLSPTLGKGIGLAYLPPRFARPGQPIEIEIRGRRFPAVTCKRPFHQPAKPSS